MCVARIELGPVKVQIWWIKEWWRSPLWQAPILTILDLEQRHTKENVEWGHAKNSAKVQVQTSEAGPGSKDMDTYTYTYTHTHDWHACLSCVHGCKYLWSWLHAFLDATGMLRCPANDCFDKLCATAARQCCNTVSKCMMLSSRLEWQHSIYC